MAGNNSNFAGVDHGDLAASESDFNATSQVRDCSASFNSVSSIADNESAFGEPVSPVNVDDLMRRAYGTTLINSGGSGTDSPWYQRWEKVVQHSGNHYILPGGPTGRRYFDLLTEEVQHLGVGNYPSERVLVFSSVILQRDRMIRKGADIRRLLDQCITQWCEGLFDLLIQEADRCDRGLKHSRGARLSKDGIVQIFSRLMLQGKVRAAVR